MPRDLFGSGTTPVALTRAFSRYTVLGSAALHLVIIAVVLIVPLLADDVLPRPNLGRVQFVTQAMVRPTTPPAATPQVRRLNTLSHDLPPSVTPSTIRDEQPPTPVDAAEGSLDIEGTTPATTGLTGVGDAVGPPAPVQPVPPPVRQAPRGPVPVGGLIHAPVPLSRVPPVYPSIAQAARVEGTVVIQAVIGVDGTVQEAHVVSGSPLLNDAALNAVKQWRYTPTTLNNQPIAVIMTVNVTFSLQH